jgi:DNA-directed RNA polymerase subunit RPC12/RpoP
MKKTMKCSNCGKTFELETGKNYCPECGSVLWNTKFVRSGLRSIK